MIFRLSFITLLLFGFTSCGPLDVLDAVAGGTAELGAGANVLEKNAIDAGVALSGEGATDTKEVTKSTGNVISNLLSSLQDLIGSLNPGLLLNVKGNGKTSSGDSAGGEGAVEATNENPGVGPKGETATAPKTGTKGGAPATAEEPEAAVPEAGAGADTGAGAAAAVADPATPVTTTAAPAAGEAAAAPVAAEADTGAKTAAAAAV